MAIITLTRQSGSMGDEIGMLIARRLGYTFYDRKEIERRIIKKGLSAEELKKWDAEHRELLDKIAPEEFEIRHYAAMTVLKKN